MDLKELILDTIDDDFIISLVEEVGGRLISNNGTTIIFTSVCHQSNSPKLYYYKESKNFYCYSCCGSLSVFDFIMTCLDCEFGESVKFLRERLNLGDINFSDLRGKDFKQLAYEKEHKEEIARQEALLFKQTMNSRLPEISSRILNYFSCQAYIPWQSEGFDKTTLDEFNIKFHYPTTSIIIPHYNEKSELVGIRRRTFDLELLNTGKYRPFYLENVSYAHRLGMNLYGLNKVKNTLRSSQRVIVAEGEKSAIKSWQWFKRCSITVSSCGFNLTQWQINVLVNRCQCKEIILCFDCDFIGSNKNKFDEWSLRVLRVRNKIREMFPWVTITIMYDKGKYLSAKENCFDKDTPEIYRHLFKNRKDITTNDTL